MHRAHPQHGRSRTSALRLEDLDSLHPRHRDPARPRLSAARHRRRRRRLPPQGRAAASSSKTAQVIGSELLAQSFTSDQYFHPRPSAAGNGYDATTSGGSNLAQSNAKLVDRIQGSIDKLATENPGKPVPIDLVTTSGSGLDPDITPDAAYFQAPARRQSPRHHRRPHPQADRAAHNQPPAGHPRRTPRQRPRPEPRPRQARQIASRSYGFPAHNKAGRAIALPAFAAFKVVKVSRPYRLTSRFAASGRPDR